MIMADPNASGKSNRFVGICIQRGGKGLGATFVLRNIINNQGEVCLFCKKCLLNAEDQGYCMRKLGAAEKYVSMVQDMHKNRKTAAFWDYITDC